MEFEEIKKLISQMTLEEKAGLCSGRDERFTKSISRLEIPSIRTSDGPHGLRFEINDENGTCKILQSVCFPTASASATSFDCDLLFRMGEAIGKECQAMDVQVLLGPGINIKRSPLCGRNFEYFSEDPLLAGELGIAFVQGVQSQGVGTSLKHFFANNQEHRRMSSSSEMDDRTMREIYLAAFERVVKRAQPWTLMSSYNKIKGTYSTANKKYITDTLRHEWAFEGLVVSDWGATHDRIAAVEAGTDLTMPAAIESDCELVLAVQNGTLTESVLDAACERILTLVFKVLENRQEGIKFDCESDHALAREIAGQSMVLLKNEDILPLKKGGKYAFIGAFAETPRYQGGGSSHINSYKVIGALNAARGLDGVSPASILYAQGYRIDSQEPDEILTAEALEAAKGADVAVIFAGLPEMMEVEGYDRPHMSMPLNQNELIAAVCAVQPNTVVVLHNGSPVEIPWVHAPKAILETYLGGEAVGEATVDVLFGAVNPSGRLAESFPNKLEDNPSYLFFPGENGVVEYSERMFVGYRYYESKKMEVLFPFGHGLSYTTFIYSNLRLDKTGMTDADTLTVAVDVANTGDVKGKEVVQLYVSPKKREIIRPVRELKGFEKIELSPGERKTVTFTLDKHAFAYWNTTAHDWVVETNEYTVQIGRSCHDIVSEQKVQVASQCFTELLEYTLTTPLSDFVRHPLGKQLWEANMGKMFAGMARAGVIPEEALKAMSSGAGAIEQMSRSAGMHTTGTDPFAILMSQPVSLLSTYVDCLSEKDLKDLFDKMNQ